MNFVFSRAAARVSYEPAEGTLTVSVGSYSVQWADTPYLCTSDGEKLAFSDAHCESTEEHTGTSDGVSAVYSGFSGTDGRQYPFSVHTRVYFDKADGDLHTSVRVENADGEISRIAFPPRFGFDAREGEDYTILPRMQGTLVPAGHPITLASGIIFERDAYIPVYGQQQCGAGWTAIYETPYDARYLLCGEEVQPYFVPSLGSFAEPRSMCFRFFEKDFDFNVLAKTYRKYLIDRGEFVTLKEKIIRNPNVEKLLGTPIIHTTTAVHISPQSSFYHEREPEKNDSCVTFAKREQQLRALREKGVERAYLHLDGWGRHGYDNLHPDVFPPNEGAGGADGMRKLQKACTELGYLFGIHDQYRDYYYDADTFSFENAVTNADGSHPYCSVWYGGPHSYLCASLAPDYVRRNYNEFESLGIHIDGAYLDVFSVVEMDECFHPDHPMTREQCARHRRETLDILTSRGIIPSSEEVLGCIIDSQVLCHHAPFFTKKLGADDSEPAGIPVPLLDLVYHDCVIIPWGGLSGRGGWGIPKDDSGFLWALLSGGTVYYDIEETDENIERGKIALELHKRTALCELVSHVMIDGNIRRRRSVFSDGTVVEADFDTEEYRIIYKDEACDPEFNERNWTNKS